MYQYKFSEERIRSALDRLQKSRQKSTQGRIDSFFKTTGNKTTEPSSKKRKAEEEKAKANAKGAGAAAAKKGKAIKKGK